ncbi:unnamed protein product [Durusdinium trenchii]|uniref:Uncharacterized protein n=2 Tax=Durusdinium trenchii TaxID=1381693 RepID=A0ABP0L9S1_9DINO
MEPPSPPPEVPLPPPPRPPPNTEEAVVRVQRWYRAQARRRRFMIIINRARRRRKYLEERRRVAQRVYSTEAAVEEMKARLAMPYGHRLVGRYSEARDAEAATRVQTLWRSVRAKKKLVKLIGEQQQQEAARRLQAFARRRWQRRRQSPLVQSAVANPFWRPIQEDRVKQHESEVVRKRKEWSSLTGHGLTESQLKLQAEEKYTEFLDGAGRWRYDVWRSLMECDQTRRMMEVLARAEGRGFESPTYGICSAFLLKEAKEKHAQRTSNMVQSQLKGLSICAESATEEKEADLLLHGLEAELGYDFSMPDV